MLYNIILILLPSSDFIVGKRSIEILCHWIDLIIVKKNGHLIRHVSDLHDIPFSFALSVSPRSSFHAYLFNIFRNTLSQSNMPLNKPLLMLRWPLHRRVVMHQMCFSYPSKKKKKKKIWLDLVMKFWYQIYEFFSLSLISLLRIFPLFHL